MKNDLTDLIFAPWTIHILFTANRLKIFSNLTERELTADEISSLTHTKPRYLKGLMDACVAIGLLKKKDDKYMNSHISDAHLVEGRPLYIGDIIEVQSIEAKHWEGLYNLITEKSPIDEEKTKGEPSPYLFTLAMNNLGMLGEAEALAAAVDLSEHKTLLDVGCGSGIYSITLCRHYPKLHATLLDKEEVLEVTSRFIRKSRLQDRINTRACDITKDSFGSKKDAVLLSDVLYQDSDVCHQILRSAYNALSPEGILIVRGYYADPERTQPLFGAVFALGQLLFNEGREFITIPILQDWVKEAGFKVEKMFALTGRSTCITAVK